MLHGGDGYTALGGGKVLIDAEAGKLMANTVIDYIAAAGQGRRQGGRPHPQELSGSAGSGRGGCGRPLRLAGWLWTWAAGGL